MTLPMNFVFSRITKNKKTEQMILHSVIKKPEQLKTEKLGTLHSNDSTISQILNDEYDVG